MLHQPKEFLSFDLGAVVTNERLNGVSLVLELGQCRYFELASTGLTAIKASEFTLSIMPLKKLVAIHIVRSILAWLFPQRAGPQA